MTHVLVTGASGLLGINLALIAVNQGFSVTGWTNSRSLSEVPFTTETVDLADLDSLPRRLEDLRPDVIIHCAAMANVDQVEKNLALAERINAQAPGVIAESAAKLGTKLIHISTDAVFDGVKGDYIETDLPNPLNTYARSKLNGEKAVLSADPRAVIARVVFYGWSLNGNRSLAEFFYNNLSAEKTVNGFTDMYFTPLYVGHLAELLLQIAETDLSGIYHVFGSQVISKYAFGVTLAREFNLDESLVSPHSALESDLQAPRPLNLSMNTKKLQEALSQDLPSVQQGLEALHQAFSDGLRQQLAKFII